MMVRILLDTGPWVAALDQSDHFHAWAVEQFRTLPLPFYTCEAVVTETAHLLSRTGSTTDVLFSLVLSEAVIIDYSLAEDRFQVAKLMRQYQNVPMALADVCLVRMTDTYTQSQVLTLDRDFYIYRRQHNRAIEVVIPTSRGR